MHGHHRHRSARPQPQPCRTARGTGPRRGVLDTRDAERYAAGHWPDSINIALDGPFALNATLAFCGNAEIALISDPGTEVEARNRLALLGLHRVAGVLAGGLGPLDAGRLVAPVREPRSA